MIKPVNTAGYFFTEEHQWIRIEDNIAVIGLTSLAKKELGSVDRISIHTIGKHLVENQVFGRLHTKQYLCKLIMPFRGEIIESNTINFVSFNNSEKDIDPDEWIVKVRIALPLKPDKLYSMEQYQAFRAKGSLHLVKYFSRNFQDDAGRLA